eukprot:4387408-Prymnesium_polylepis.1
MYGRPDHRVRMGATWGEFHGRGRLTRYGGLCGLLLMRRQSSTKPECPAAASGNRAVFRAARHGHVDGRAVAEPRRSGISALRLRLPEHRPELFQLVDPEGEGAVGLRLPHLLHDIHVHRDDMRRPRADVHQHSCVGIPVVQAVLAVQGGAPADCHLH